MFNEKLITIQIAKMTHDIMIPWENLILLNQQVQNTSFLTIHTNYTKIHMHQLQTIYDAFNLTFFRWSLVVWRFHQCVQHMLDDSLHF